MRHDSTDIYKSNLCKSNCEIKSTIYVLQPIYLFFPLNIQINNYYSFAREDQATRGVRYSVSGVRVEIFSVLCYMPDPTCLLGQR